MAVIQLCEWLVSLVIGFIGGRRAKSRMIRVENHARYVAIFDEFVRLFNCVQWNNQLGRHDLLRFKGATHEARWLFGPEIPAYADEVLAHGRKLWIAKTQVKEMPPGDEKQRSLEVQHTEEGWFLQQYKVVDEKFTGYLDLSN